jgi:hypothetical protein
MLGRQCVAVSLAAEESLWTLAQDLVLVVQKAPRTDSLGRGIVAYWPDVPWRHEGGDVMDLEAVIARLKELQESDDLEAAHGEADDILCQLLRQLGYADVIDAWKQVPKWYA